MPENMGIEINKILHNVMDPNKASIEARMYCQIVEGLSCGLQIKKKTQDKKYMQIIDTLNWEIIEEIKSKNLEELRDIISKRNYN